MARLEQRFAASSVLGVRRRALRGQYLGGERRTTALLLIEWLIAMTLLASCGRASNEDVESFRLVAIKASSLKAVANPPILMSQECLSVEFGDWIDLNHISRRIIDGLEADSNAGALTTAPMQVYLGTLDLSYSRASQAIYSRHLGIPDGQVSRERVYESIIAQIDDATRMASLYRELPERDRDALLRQLEYLNTGEWWFESSTTAMITVSQISAEDGPIYRIQIAFRPEFARLNLVIRGGDINAISRVISRSLCDDAPEDEQRIQSPRSS